MRLTKNGEVSQAKKLPKHGPSAITSTIARCSEALTPPVTCETAHLPLDVSGLTRNFQSGRAAKAMRGHNRTLALQWVARCEWINGSGAVIMRKITTRYDGECGKCHAELPVGTEIMYEKRTGVFCIGCQPTDVEEIRAYRQEKADRKADRIEGWADSAEARSDALSKESTDMISVIPMGQPILVGHHSEKRDRRYRDRAWNKMGKAVEEGKKAERHRDRAEGLRHVVVKGDAERKRQAYRDEMDKRITKGSRVEDACFGTGTVIRVCKKSYRIEWDRLKDGTSRIFSRDKSYVRPLREAVTA